MGASLVSFVSGGGIGAISLVSTGGAIGAMMGPGQPTAELATSNNVGKWAGFIFGL
ncbi:MAG: hypothetical protein AAGA48_13840 [Myxococcota bacterium]